MVELVKVDEELTPEEDEKLKAGGCPKCGSTHFVKGPSGGNAINVACENGHRFWFAPPFISQYQGIIKVERDDDRLRAWF
jgi:hypothetical protein